MAEVMQGLLQTARKGDWLFHLASIHAMILWCFAYDKLNYVHFLPYYYAAISPLHINHPEVHQQFMQGSFSIQPGSQNALGYIPVDQMVEEMAN